MGEKKEIKIKFSSIICVVLIILLLAGCGALYYLGIVEKGKQIETAQSEKATLEAKNKELENQISKAEEEKKEITVVDAVNYVDGYDKLFKVRLPKVVGNTDTIETLNKKILDEVLPRTYFYSVAHASVPESFNKGTEMEYKYLIKDDILVIYIYTTIPEGSAVTGGSGKPEIEASYYYDIQKDKILSVSDAAEKLELDIDEIETKEGQKISSYSDLEDNNIEIVIYNDVLKLEQYF